MKNCRLTGGLGPTGFYLIPLLVKNLRVTAISRGNLLKQWNNEKLQVLTMNLAQNWLIESLPDDVDIVIHFAQSGTLQRFANQVVDVFNVNIASTFQLLEYSRKLRLLLLFMLHQEGWMLLLIQLVQKMIEF